MDAVFAHMSLCMALSTEEIHAVVDEIGRVLRPCGSLVYTVRHTGDVHYGTGVAHEDGIFEHGGFAVHFFDRGLVDALRRLGPARSPCLRGRGAAAAFVAGHPEPAPVAAGAG
ncbi:MULTISPECIES: hypothetical protein [unclassified Streptomyces]|uniref:hypothetical protein n=1 Tax=unclassified Streptomyces TaxID=2593676 RepID=UPI003816FD8C